MDSLLVSELLVREAWVRIQSGTRMRFIDLPTFPPREDISLETLMTERAEIYAYVPPPGTPISIKVASFQTGD